MDIRIGARSGYGRRLWVRLLLGFLLTRLFACSEDVPEIPPEENAVIPAYFSIKKFDILPQIYSGEQTDPGTFPADNFIFELEYDWIVCDRRMQPLQPQPPDTLLDRLVERLPLRPRVKDLVISTLEPVPGVAGAGENLNARFEGLGMELDSDMAIAKNYPIADYLAAYGDNIARYASEFAFRRDGRFTGRYHLVVTLHFADGSTLADTTRALNFVH